MGDNKKSLHGCPDWMNPKYNPCAKVDPKTGRFQVLDFSSLRPPWMDYAGTIASSSHQRYRPKVIPNPDWRVIDGFHRLEEVSLDCMAHSIDFIPNDKYLAFCDESNTIRMMEVDVKRGEFKGMKTTKTLPFTDVLNGVDVSFSPCGNNVAMVSEKCIEFLKIDWLRMTLDSSFKYDNTLAVTCDFSPDGKHLAVGQMNGLVRVVEIDWRSKQVKETPIHDHFLECYPGVSFSPDGVYLAIRRDDIIVVSEVDYGKGCFWETPLFIQEMESVFDYRVAFTPCGNYIGTHSDNQFVLDAINWFDEYIEDSGFEISHNYEVMDIAFSNDGSKLVTVTSDQTLTMYHLVWK